jgi:hypothetical protein
MECNRENEEEEDEGKDDEEEENEEEQDEEEEEEEEEDGEEDEDDGKEPRTIRQGGMANTSPDNVDTMVDDQPIVLPEQRQQMRKHNPQP